MLKNEKKLIIIFLFFLAALTYIYPLVKYSKNRLDCENNAKNYIVKNKNLINIKRNELNMLSTNFCNGGDEIYEIKNLEDWSNDLFPYKITKNLCNFINLISNINY